MVRVACYIHQIPAAVEMVEYFHDLGYETTCNIMAVSQANSDQIAEALDMLGNSSVDVIYLVDSYGSLYPETAEELAKKYLEVGENTAKQSVFMLITIKTLLSPTPLKQCHTVFHILTLLLWAWAEEQVTAQWNFCSASSRILNIIYTAFLLLLKNTWFLLKKAAYSGDMIYSICSPVSSTDIQGRLWRLPLKTAVITVNFTRLCLKISNYVFERRGLYARVFYMLFANHLLFVDNKAFKN